ncbi:MAG TPA: hypothetical protein VFN55_11950 [Solirubrobacteraceae bacterium]|nr:hypothetical protein [Solirubrobacteraceae bacterium]
MSRARRTLFPAAVAGLALAGCGGQSADASHAAQTLTRAFHALAAGDGATVCALATPAGQRSLAAAVPGAGCAKVVDLVSAHLTGAQRAALGTVRVTGVSVHGAQASVRARDITSRRGSLRGFLAKSSAPTRLRRQPDGSWKIEG